MIKDLQFVKGAVAKKDYDPTLTHFLIRNKRVWGFNGVIGLSSPINSDLDIAPKCGQFLQALDACDDTVTLVLMPNGQLAVKSGGFRTLVDCIEPEQYKGLPPNGAFVEVDGGMLAAIKRLRPFIGFDASRQWACGILFKGASAFATNNIVAIEYELGYTFPITVNIPVQAVNELIRINEEPLGLQVCEDRLTFYYEGGRWLITKLSALEWPNLAGAFDAVGCDVVEPFPQPLKDAVRKLLPFTDEMNRVIFTEGKVSTTKDSDATVVACEDAPHYGEFNGGQLMLLDGVADNLAISRYPKPVPFNGERIRGVIAGLR